MLGSGNRRLSPIFQSTHKNKINIAKHSKCMLYLDFGFGICMSNAMQSAEQFHSENRQFEHVLFLLSVWWPIKIRHFPSCALFSIFFSYLHSFIAKLKVLFQDLLICVFFVVSFVVNCTHTNRNYFRAVANPKHFLLSFCLFLSRSYRISTMELLLSHDSKTLQQNQVLVHFFIRNSR